MLDVFVSYSRKNLDFVQHLITDLEAHQKQLWFDKKKEPLAGIPAGSLWWDEIKHGIETADNFLIIISPESMASPYCHAEIAHALQHDKRIVTLLYCDEQSQVQTLNDINHVISAIPPEMTLPATVSADMTNVRSLARRNWLELSQIQFVVYEAIQNWQQWLQQVVSAVDLDIQWVRTWGRVQQTVQLWVENDYSDDFLWNEGRLAQVREQVERRNQALTDDEMRFLEPEQSRLLRELDDVEVTHWRRMAIGERLALIGDTRRGVGLRADGLPDIDWCYVDVPEQLRATPIAFPDAEGEIYTEQVLQPFWIAKYLLTYQQEQALVELLEERRWWQGLIKMPVKIDSNPLANNPHRANWFVAMAITRVLDGLLPDDAYPEAARGSAWQTRLANDWEWHWAACGGNLAQEYPWGAWDERYFNSDRSGLNRVTAVGMYPMGQAACGALDMAGQAAEWCLNRLPQEPTKSQRRGVSKIHKRLIRGRAKCLVRQDMSVKHKAAVRIVRAARVDDTDYVNWKPPEHGITFS